jgi:hypothetical protein
VSSKSTGLPFSWPLLVEQVGRSVTAVTDVVNDDRPLTTSIVHGQHDARHTGSQEAL